MKNINKPYVIHGEKLPHNGKSFEDLKSLWDYLFEKDWSKDFNIEIEDKFKELKIDILVLGIDKA